MVRNIRISEIKELKDFPPTMKMSWGMIVDTKLFFETHISFLEHNSGNRTFLPYYERLVDFYKAVNEEVH